MTVGGWVITTVKENHSSHTETLVFKAFSGWQKHVQVPAQTILTPKTQGQDPAICFYQAKGTCVVG